MKKLVNGVEVELTQAEILEVQAREQAHLERMAEEDKMAYARLRANEYPSVEDQLDIIYHAGLEGWGAMIQSIKDKYPKPRS